ncbi:hypothetical protein GOV08_03575 [Candidatus Woesearchaeota archaeon]|nr:hypothetical protein [Candidatus Woesearchaeota archaeon]
MGEFKVKRRLHYIILNLLFSILIAGAVSAQIPLYSDFDVAINTSKGVIFEDEVAEYELTITNNGINEENFVSPYTSDPDWIVTSDPQVFKVGPKETKKYTLYVDPKATVAPGQYGVILNVKSSLTEEVDKSLFLIFIKPLNPLPLGYVSSIALNVEIPTEIDPRAIVPVGIYLRNRNAREYDNLTISIESKLINKVYGIPFDSLEEKTEKFNFKLSDFEPPQEDNLIVTLSNEDEVINQLKVPIRVIPYSEIQKDKDVTEKFLKTKTFIKLTNFGNTQNNKPYKYQVGFFENLVTFTKPDSERIKENGKRFRTFETSLEPRETIDIEVVTNYRYIVYLILLTILSILAYYQLRNPIVSKKEAITSSPSHEGVSEFKIRVLVRNRSQNPVENVKVIESVPSLAKLVKESTLGTLEPTKIIKHDKRGTIIRWDINYLEPFEERIITYKIKSKLNIVGSLTLPATKIKYETFRGRERVTHSKKHRIKIYA